MPLFKKDIRCGLILNYGLLIHGQWSPDANSRTLIIPYLLYILCYFIIYNHILIIAGLADLGYTPVAGMKIIVHSKIRFAFYFHVDRESSLPFSFFEQVVRFFFFCSFAGMTVTT